MVLDGHVPDALLVPISLSYDRVLETASYVAELQGEVKKKENGQASKA